MHEALKGTWILKEYEDSTDAGLTPKLLAYLLGTKSQISYDMDHMIISGFEPMRDGMLNYTGPKAVYALRFDAPDRRLVIEIRSDTTSTDFDDEGSPIERKLPSRIVEIDTADFIVEGADTILRLNVGANQKDFVKYANTKCPDQSVYIHLVNSKFITGKYYALTDTGHAHHIAFTRCGGLEGAGNIDASLTEMTEYEVNVANFTTKPDAIEFYNPEYKIGRTFYWQVDHDSLILYQDAQDKEKQIVLVKTF
jgi:hypothetical protein